jgi:hypothetical protein
MVKAPWAGMSRGVRAAGDAGTGAVGRRAAGVAGAPEVFARAGRCAMRRVPDGDAAASMSGLGVTDARRRRRAHLAASHSRVRSQRRRILDVRDRHGDAHARAVRAAQDAAAPSSPVLR